MRTKRAVSSRRKHSLKVKSGGGQFKTIIDKDEVKQAPLILSCPEFKDLATDLATNCNFIKGNVYFDKYGDGTPKVFMDELTVKLLRNRKVYFLAYFSFNECTGENPATNIMDQYMFMCSLASYGIQELNIVLPYFPTGTMERIVGEGELGTGYYLAHLLNSIPCGAYKNVLYVMDMHALCSRFFFHTNIRTVFITMMPKYLDIIQAPKTEVLKVFSVIVFPDDGAEKRNKELCKGSGVKFITCSKKRSGDDRTIEITGSIDELKKAILDGNKIEFYIVDDLVQTGGTLGETAKKLVETLHNEFSPLDNVKTSTLNHIKTKCFKPEAYKQKITTDSISDEIIKHYLTQYINAIGGKKAEAEAEATVKALTIIEKAKLAINTAVEAATEAKRIADEKAATKEADVAKEAKRSKSSSRNSKGKKVLENKSGLIGKLLKKFVITKAQTDQAKDAEAAEKKQRDIIKDIVDSCIFFSGIDTLPTKNRLDNASKFVINYVVTHSILPKANPISAIINSVLFFKEYENMVEFNYTTTNSRPYVATTLTTKPNNSMILPDQTTGITTHTMANGTIKVLSITDVLTDVFTNVDSPYIAPYIIPNVSPDTEV